MHISRTSPVLGLILLLATAGWPWLDATAWAGGFSNADIDGDYGYALRGTTTDPFGNQFPVSVIGQMTVVNSVATRHTRTFNIGGLGIVDGTLAGQAEVAPDGRGVAVFCGDNTVRPPAILPLFPRKSLEVFEFVLTGRHSNEIEVTGTGFDALPDDFDIATCPPPSHLMPGVQVGDVIVGTVRRQHPGRDRED